MTSSTVDWMFFFFLAELCSHHQSDLARCIGSADESLSGRDMCTCWWIISALTLIIRMTLGKLDINKPAANLTWNTRFAALDISEIMLLQNRWTLFALSLFSIPKQSISDLSLVVLYCPVVFIFSGCFLCFSCEEKSGVHLFKILYKWLAIYRLNQLLLPCYLLLNTSSFWWLQIM